LSVCARLKRPPELSLLGYDGKKDTSMPMHQVVSKG
jgi:hypothetical protein